MHAFLNPWGIISHAHTLINAGDDMWGTADRAASAGPDLYFACTGSGFCGSGTATGGVPYVWNDSIVFSPHA
jgi:hypothetical protein